MRFREKFGLLVAIMSVNAMYHIEDNAIMIASMIGLALGTIMFLWRKVT